MSEQDSITVLRRDVDALLIPSGAKILLQAGTELRITQALGGSFTVNIYGNLARVDAKDADALGRDAPDDISAEQLQNMPIEELVWAKMKQVYDPEIPVNVVDLGLIYACEVLPLRRDEHRVDIKMTLTAPGCGMGPVIAEDVRMKVLSLPTVAEANIELVFDPPWDREKMSDAAKLQLGMF